MTDAEFWQQCYIAAVRAGMSNVAQFIANRALKDYKELKV